MIWGVRGGHDVGKKDSRALSLSVSFLLTNNGILPLNYKGGQLLMYGCVHVIKQGNNSYIIKLAGIITTQMSKSTILY